MSFRLTETLLAIDQKWQVAYKSCEEEDCTLPLLDLLMSGFHWPLH